MNGEEAPKFSDRLVWIDIETTGTEDHDVMLEIAVIVTDNDLKELGCMSSLILDCNPRNLVRADQPRTKDSDIPCWEQHFESGLVTSLIEELAGDGLDPTMSIVEEAVLRFLDGRGVYLTIRPAPPLCGTSVHFDRRFLRRHMPRVVEALHYRNIDVSGIRETARRFSPELELPEIEIDHRAEGDLRASIELLRFFRESGYLGI